RSRRRSSQQARSLALGQGLRHFGHSSEALFVDRAVERVEGIDAAVVDVALESSIHALHALALTSLDQALEQLGFALTKRRTHASRADEDLVDGDAAGAVGAT